MSSKYDDIIGLPHFKAPGHSQMPLNDRAAQFAPFKSLTGFEDNIEEAAHINEASDEKNADVSDDFSDI